MSTIDDLAKCREELRALEEENRHLRDAATTFGGLAERLNLELRRERRTPQTIAGIRNTRVIDSAPEGMS